MILIGGWEGEHAESDPQWVMDEIPDLIETTTPKYLLTRSLIEELMKRHPDLVGPLKDQLEELDALDRRRK